MTGAHLMTVDAPSTLPLRLADLSGSYNIQMTGTGGWDAEPVSEVAPKALTSFVQDDIGCQERL